MTLSNWQRGEPSDHSKVCVVISRENQLMWKTADCSEDHLLFICQRKDKPITVVSLGQYSSLFFRIRPITFVSTFARRLADRCWIRLRADLQNATNDVGLICYVFCCDKGLVYAQRTSFLLFLYSLTNNGKNNIIKFSNEI